MDSKIHLTYWAIIVCVVFAALYFWNRNGRGEEIRLNENQKFQKRMQIKDSLATRAIADERSKRSADSAKTALRLQSLGKANTLLAKKIAILRPDIQPYLDSIQSIADFVALQDSSLGVKDSTITVLKVAIAVIGQSFDREIKDWMQKDSVSHVRIAAWETESNKNAALYFKADKKARKRFSFGPYIGYGMSNNGLSPSVGVSVQYRLIRW